MMRIALRCAVHHNQLFGLEIYSGTMEQLVSAINAHDGKLHIISGNAEVLKYPLKNNTIYTHFCRTENLIIPDGISVYLPLKRKSKEAKKIAGISLMQTLLGEYNKNTHKSVYFLGAKESVITKMIHKVHEEYPFLEIAGFHHGYFDKNNCSDIVESIKQSEADTIFVALGTPFQEDFIFKYMDALPCTLFMGVGGSFDVLSGTIKRSPAWINALGFEWLYRLLKDPKKIDRVRNNIAFTLKALIYG